MMDVKDKIRIFNHIRLGFRQSQTYRNVIARSVSDLDFGPLGGKRYVCAKCRFAHEKKQIEVDHILPVVPRWLKKIDMTMDKVIGNTYCGEMNLQVLCKPCHKEKTYAK